MNGPKPPLMGGGGSDVRCDPDQWLRSPLSVYIPKYCSFNIYLVYKDVSYRVCDTGFICLHFLFSVMPLNVCKRIL
jgi:hypothetical protein